MLRHCLIATLLVTASVPAMAAEVRMCEREIRTALLSDERGVQSALLQGFAVINNGDKPAKLTHVLFQIKEQRDNRDMRWLLPADIARAAKGAPQVAALAQIFPFQLCNGELLAGAKLATSELLAPGEAVVFTHQPFTWKGKRDAMEVVAVTEVDGVPRNDLISRPIVQGVSKTELLYPVAGRTYAGVAASLHTPHRWASIEEFALDIAALAPTGLTYRGKGTKLSDYAGFGRPIRAVASGKVVAASDGMEDNAAMLKRPEESDEAYLARLQDGQMALLSKGIAAVLGNHVVIDHGIGEYSIYAHLKQGSVRFAKGAEVAAGETIGLLGSSGNSTEPHLHFQICDGPDVATCRPIPPNFTGYRIMFEFGPRTIQSGDIVDTVK